MARNVASGQAINLDVQFADANGNAINADSTPQIRITDPNGTIVVALTSNNVASVGTGLYRYSYTVPAGSTAGAWQDRWVGAIGGTQTAANFVFYVVSGGTVTAVEDEDLADTPTTIANSYGYTQAEIDNLNLLLDLLKKRLKSTGTRYVRDQYGAIEYDGYGEPLTEECNVFSDSELITFLQSSLSEFNSTPHFTMFTFSDIDLLQSGGHFAHIIVSGAVILGLAAQALIEKGREFTITDSGVAFQPPTVSEIINNQFSTLLSAYREDLKRIKNNLKPRPIGLGTIYSLSNYMNPYVRALRNLRERRVY